jgi:hypothetical protein
VDVEEHDFVCCSLSVDDAARLVQIDEQITGRARPLW